MIQEVGKRLKPAGLTRTTLSASDANSINEMVGNANSFDSLTRSYISQYNTHSYFGSDADRRSMADIARRHGKTLWQSETGPLSWPGGNQFDVAMWSADLILRDLREMRANAWLDWQAAGGGIWGVIDYTRSNQTSRMNKKGYAYAQFSRFIRPGSTLIASDNANTLAALVPASGSLVLVAVNTGASSVNYAFDLSRFQVLPQSAQVYRTSANQDIAALADLPVENKTVTLSAPSRSVTTLVLAGVTTTSVAVAPDKRIRAEKRRRTFGPIAGPAGMGPWFPDPAGSELFNALGRRP
jgi:O-glycosyl hydrolase